METCAPEQYRQYLETFAVPAPADRRLIADGQVGLVLLPQSQFRYDPTVGYSFELAATTETGTDRRLLFVRIDSWNPAYRDAAQPGEIDYCIPIAHPGASARERLTWTIPFGGAWSDTKQEAIVVFDPGWREWLASVPAGLAFSHPGAESGAFMEFGNGGRYGRFANDFGGCRTLGDANLPSALSQLKSWLGKFGRISDAAWHKEVCHAEVVYRSTDEARTS